jgi:NAD(P)-dependent dehydrogenase (short-subunit alcohol dehydrogenase family)
LTGLNRAVFIGPRREGQTMQPLLHSPSTGVVVTGGASGIGLASANALAAVGRPVALWDINADAAGAAAQEITETYGAPAVGVAVDLRRPDAIAPALAATRAVLPTIGGLVHSAGTSRTTGLDGVTVEEWDEGIALHVRALVLILQAIRPDLKANPGSAVVAMASINATLGAGGLPIYTAAKGAILSLVRSLADDLAHDGVRVNAVSPGFIETPMVARIRSVTPPGHFERRILLGRYGEPHEIGRLVRFLLSDEASYITAAEIVADGGNISSQRI